MSLTKINDNSTASDVIFCDRTAATFGGTETAATFGGTEA